MKLGQWREGFRSPFNSFISNYLELESVYKIVHSLKG